VFGIEHQSIEIVADIVMVRDIAFRSNAVVDRFHCKGRPIAQSFDQTWRA